jgi:hypothetical protein
LRFIPQPGVPQIRLGSGTNDDAPAHKQEYLRRRALTSAQVEPASGFWR